MKLKLTPLNIVSALSLVALFAIWIDKSMWLSDSMEAYSGLIIAMCLLVFFVSFLADQIFRKFVPSLSRLWMIQMMMLVLTAVFIVILKVSIVG